jgi:prevent-host-death family protein
LNVEAKVNITTATGNQRLSGCPKIDDATGLRLVSSPEIKTVGAYDAKTHLSRLLDDVARGESIAITRHGVTVALLIPPQEAARENAARAIAEWRRYRARENINLGDLSLRDLIEEGRR